MLNEICAEIRNYFTYAGDIHVGDFHITSGNIYPPFEIATNYIRIVGSHKNDGVHVYTEKDGWGLIDEGEFHGGIWVMSPPKDFLDLAAEIAAWQAKNGALDSPAMSPFNSESFGGYSYSKSSSYASGGSSSGGADWKSAFAPRLNIYRRFRVI